MSPPHRVADEPEDDIDGDWDFPNSLLGDVAEDLLGTGTLIVEAGEDAMAARDPTEMDLSVPGSIPSDIGSLHDLTGSVNGALLETEQEQVAGGPRVIHRPSFNRPTILVLIGGVLAMSLFSSAYLVWERQSLRTTTIKLEERILQLEQSLKPTQQKAPKNPSVLPWEACGEDAKETNEDPTVLVDNCWLQAKAKVELGTCANEAQEAAKKKLKGFGKTLKTGTTKLQNKFDQAVDDLGKTFNEYMKEEKLEPGTAEGNTNASDATKTTDLGNKKLISTATTVVSGIAFASIAVAALFVDGSLSLFADSPRDTADTTSFV